MLKNTGKRLNVNKKPHFARSPHAYSSNGSVVETVHRSQMLEWLNVLIIHTQVPADLCIFFFGLVLFLLGCSVDCHIIWFGRAECIRCTDDVCVCVCVSVSVLNHRLHIESMNCLERHENNENSKKAERDGTGMKTKPKRMSERAWFELCVRVQYTHHYYYDSFSASIKKKKKCFLHQWQIHWAPHSHWLYSEPACAGIGPNYCL